MIVRIEELDYNSQTGVFQCPDHPDRTLQPILWSGTGFICEATVVVDPQGEAIECLNYAQWSSVEVRDEEICRHLRLARQATEKATQSHMPWARLPTIVRHLFVK